MKMHRRSLLNSTALRHIGIMSIEGDGTAESGGASNNQTGNQESGGNKTGTQDNGGQAFDYGKFWDQPIPGEGNGSPEGGSAESKPNGGGGPQADNGVGDFTKRLSEVSFGPVFSDQALKDLSEGKIEGINQAIGQQLQQATQQSVRFTAELIQKSQQALLSRVEEMLQGTLGKRDNNDALSKEFPSYNNPGVRPVIDGIFQRSLALAKGDRAEAIKHTREMLRFVGTTGAQDMGLNTPPDDAHGSGGANAGVKSLLDDILGRT